MNTLATDRYVSNTHIFSNYENIGLSIAVGFRETRAVPSDRSIGLNPIHFHTLKFPETPRPPTHTHTSTSILVSLFVSVCTRLPRSEARPRNVRRFSVAAKF